MNSWIRTFSFSLNQSELYRSYNWSLCHITQRDSVVLLIEAQWQCWRETLGPLYKYTAIIYSNYDL